MSTQAAAQFLSKVAKDPRLQKRATSIAEGGRDPVAEAVKLGSEHGLEFTAAEFEQVLNAARASGKGELSDAELEHVAGGAVDMFLKISSDLSSAGGLFFGTGFKFNKSSPL